MSATLPLGRGEWATAELGEILFAGKTPSEVEALGWEGIAALMQQRKDLILQAEVEAAPGCLVD